MTREIEPMLFWSEKTVPGDEREQVYEALLTARETVAAILASHPGRPHPSMQLEAGER